MNGKTTAAVGNSTIKVRGRSGKKYPFQKKPREGYFYDTENNEEITDLFEGQSGMYPYFFTPILKETCCDKEPVDIEIEGLDKKDLKKLCDKLGIKTVPQDRESSMKRMLEAYKLGTAA